jgi:hypothetical protein
MREIRAEIVKNRPFATPISVKSRYLVVFVLVVQATRLLSSGAGLCEARTGVTDPGYSKPDNALVRIQAADDDGPIVARRQR